MDPPPPRRKRKPGLPCARTWCCMRPAPSPRTSFGGQAVPCLCLLKNVDLQPPSVTSNCRRLPPRDVGYLQLPSVTSNCRRLPPTAVGYLQLPSVTSNCRRSPPTAVGDPPTVVGTRSPPSIAFQLPSSRRGLPFQCRPIVCPNTEAATGPPSLFIPIKRRPALSHGLSACPTAACVPVPQATTSPGAPHGR